MNRRKAILIIFNEKIIRERQSEKFELKSVYLSISALLLPCFYGLVLFP